VTCRRLVRALLALALVGCASAAEQAPPPPVAPPILSAEALLDEYAARCAGPEGLLDCAPDAFRDHLVSMRARGSELEERWLAGVEAGGHSGAYGLAWLRAPTESARGASIPLPARPFRSASNPCTFEVASLPKGDFVATLGFSATAPPAPIATDEVRVLGGRVLEILARHHQVDPALFIGETTVSSISNGKGRIIAVSARATSRAPGGQAVSVTAVYREPGDGTGPRERLVVASHPGELVRVAGFVAWAGAEPLVVVSRTAPDGWEFELYDVTAESPRLVARGAEGSGA
jgi:hypothetical protein